MKSLEEFIIDPIELDIFTSGFDKRIGKLDKLEFTYYTRDALSVLKKQFSLVDKTQFSISPEYECTTPNSVHSGIGR